MATRATSIAAKGDCTPRCFDGSVPCDKWVQIVSLEIILLTPNSFVSLSMIFCRKPYVAFLSADLLSANAFLYSIKILSKHFCSLTSIAFFCVFDDPLWMTICTTRMLRVRSSLHRSMHICGWAIAHRGDITWRG